MFRSLLLGFLAAAIAYVVARGVDFSNGKTLQYPPDTMSVDKFLHWERDTATLLNPFQFGIKSGTIELRS
ncbi:MAG: hypothetical protein ABIR47_12295 [Candidatus Kapaibacterium sp.]